MAIAGRPRLGFADEGAERGAMFDRMLPTPARAAATGRIDRTAPRLSRPAAVAVVLVAYLLFFGRGGVRAVQVDLTGEVLDPTDFGSAAGVLEVTSRVTQLAGAVLLLVLVCRWLTIPRELAGIPRRPAHAEPALASVGIIVAGLIAGGMLLQALTGGDDPNAAAGGVVSNGWALLSLFGGLNAGVVEEIIIVALPVIVGRRADLHPLLIIGASAVLRWPFHAYHGLLPALPWTLLWGSAYTVAFLYLRRLLPLIVVHALYDAQIDMYIAYGDPGRLVVLAVGLVMVLVLAVRVVSDRRRRRDPGSARLTAGVVRFMIARADRALLAAAAVVGLFTIAALILLIGRAPDLQTAIASVTAVAVTAGAAAGLGLVSWVNSNWIVRRDPAGGPVTGVIRWHTGYTGQNVLDSCVGVDDLTAARQIADRDHRDIVLVNTKTRRRMLADRAITYRTSGVLRRLRIRPQDLGDPDTVGAVG